MKNILIIHPALVVGGAETVLINYLKILSKLDKKYNTTLLLIEDRVNFNINEIPKNIKVEFILSDVESEFFIYSFLNLKKENDNYYSAWFNGIKNRIDQRILRKINSTNFDIIIDFHRNISSFDHFMNHFDISKNIKKIYWIHSQYLLDCWIKDKSYYSFILSKYDKFISINNNMLNSCNQILKEFNIGNKSSYFLYNPLDIERIKEKSLITLSEDQKLLDNDFILQVSRLDAGKNHIEMIDIFHALKQKGIKEKLYIIGEGNTEQLEARIQELNLEEECFLLGRRDNPFPFMKKAKLFIHTSLFEGLAMVLIESMVCGTPVVAYDCPTGPKEVLGDGKYGEIIPLHDKEKFIEAAYQLLTNENKRQSYISLLPEAIQRFSFQSIGEQLEQILDNA